MTTRQDLEAIAQLRECMAAEGEPVPRIVEAIVDGFGVSRVEAHRLARGWTRRRAVEAIRGTYTADGLRPPSLSVQRLCEWERKPKTRPGEDYRDRLCRVYETRADQLGYGSDYSPFEIGQPAAGVPADYGGRDPLAGDREADTDRGEFLHATGVTTLAALVDRATRASERLARILGASQVGPVTVEQLELRVAGFVRRYDHVPLGGLFAEVSAQHEEVAKLLDGPLTLGQRRGLYRVAGQLEFLLGLLSFELGDSLAAQTHFLTALQLAEEVGDHVLACWVRMNQSTVALWAGDFPSALHLVQDGQRYASGSMPARLAVRGEACAYARMSDTAGVRDALRRATGAMPSHVIDDGWWAFTSGSFQLYTGNALLWLGDAKQAEPHIRQAIAFYETAPALLQNPANQAQAQINLGVCLVRQGHPDEGIRLAGQSLQADRVHVEPNLALGDELLAALPLAHRGLAAARDLADQLHTIRTIRTTRTTGD